MTTRDDLAKFYRYDPETGELISKRLNSPVKQKNRKGYLVVENVHGKFLVHRVAFLLMEGRWPVMVDRLNRDRADNRWVNLRETDAKGNRSNSALSDPSCRAARWESKMNKWLKSNSF